VAKWQKEWRHRNISSKAGAAIAASKKNNQHQHGSGENQSWKKAGSGENIEKIIEMGEKKMKIEEKCSMKGIKNSIGMANQQHRSETSVAKISERSMAENQQRKRVIESDEISSRSIAAGKSKAK